MRDRPAIRRGGGALRIDMDELVVARRRSEGVDAGLVDRHPARHAGFLADHGLDLVDGGCDQNPSPLRA